MQEQRCVWCFQDLKKTVLEHFFFKEGFCLDCKQKLQSGFYRRQVKTVTFYHQYPKNEESLALYHHLVECGDRYLAQKLVHPYYFFYFAHRVFIPLPVEKRIMTSFSTNPNRYLLKVMGALHCLDLLSFKRASQREVILFDEDKIKDKSVLLFGLRIEEEDVFWSIYHLLKVFAANISVFTVFEN